MYKIIGADQREYGPISERQLRQWIVQGRANARTPVQYEGGPWQPLSSFPEFFPDLEPAGPSRSAGVQTPYPGAPVTNNWAVAGLAFSILGLICCCPAAVFSTLGLIFSAIGLIQINDAPESFGGRGLAIAGIVLGLLGLAQLFFLLPLDPFRHLRGF